MASDGTFRTAGSDPLRFKLDPGTVHVWDGSGPVDPARYPSFFALLDDMERQRAERFRFEQHRIRFVTCRGWLRLLLSAYTGLDPGEIRLIADHYGKPRLGDQPPNTGLVFNVSHSSERMVFAFGLDCMLGVDIERSRNITHLEGLVDRICSQAEKNHWLSVPGDRRLEFFFAIWVRKEAIIKAQGRGVSLGIAECVLSNDLERPVSLPDSCGRTGDWTLLGLDYPDGYQGAIAVDRRLDSVYRHGLPVQLLIDRLL